MLWTLDIQNKKITISLNKKIKINKWWKISYFDVAVYCKLSIKLSKNIIKRTLPKESKKQYYNEQNF